MQVFYRAPLNRRNAAVVHSTVVWGGLAWLRPSRAEVTVMLRRSFASVRFMLQRIDVTGKIGLPNTPWAEA